MNTTTTTVKKPSTKKQERIKLIKLRDDIVDFAREFERSVWTPFYNKCGENNAELRKTDEGEMLLEAKIHLGEAYSKLDEARTKIESALHLKNQPEMYS